MTIKNRKQIFSRNLVNILSLREKSQIEVARAIGISQQTFNTWVRGKALPRMDKIQLLAEYFNIQMSDLIEDNPAPVAPAAEPCDYTPLEKEIVKRFRAADEYDQMSVLRTLGIEKGDYSSLRADVG